MGFVCFEALRIRWDLCPSSTGGVGRPDIVEDLWEPRREVMR
jgi:hypothetical protein